MAFENVTEAAIEELSSTQSKAQDQPAQDISAQQRTSDSSDNSSQLFDLDKADKVMFQGKEWTRKDLERAILRERDYTQKTQSLAEERRQLQEQAKYDANLKYDLKAVLEDRNLESVFRQTYPREYHEFLDAILEKVGSSQKQDAQVSNQEMQLPKEFLQKINQMESTLSEYQKEKEQAAVRSYESQIDNTIESLAKKLEIPKETRRIFEALVVNEASNLYQSGTKLTQQLWDKIGKTISDELSMGFKASQSKLIKEQKQASAQAKDIGGGGGIPGGAPQKMALKDVKHYASRVLAGKPLNGV